MAQRLACSAEGEKAFSISTSPTENSLIVVAGNVDFLCAAQPYSSLNHLPLQ